MIVPIAVGSSLQKRLPVLSSCVQPYTETRSEANGAPSMKLWGKWGGLVGTVCSSGGVSKRQPSTLWTGWSCTVAKILWLL